MVCYDEVAVNLRDGVDVVEQAAEDGVVPDFQEGFREVLGQGVKPGGVAGGQDDGFHSRCPIRSGMTL